jgi:two-component system, cell cycle response regulator DivK
MEQRYSYSFRAFSDSFFMSGQQRSGGPTVDVQPPGVIQRLDHEPHAHRTDVQARASPGSFAGILLGAMRTATILVVDDEPLVLEVMTDVLTTAGYSVITACSGPEGIRLAQDGGVGFILMDYNMPGMSGLDAVHRLRHDPRTRSIPVALITEEAAVKYSGCVALLRKPISIARLYEIVDEVLGRDRP